MHLVGFITRIYHDARSSECLSIKLYIPFKSVFWLVIKDIINTRESVTMLALQEMRKEVNFKMKG